MTNFSTVFEISKKINNFPAEILFLIVAIFVLVIALNVLGFDISQLVLRKRNCHIWFKRLYPPLVLFMLGLIVSSASIYLLTKSSDRANELVSAYSKGKYKISEGFVHILHQQPYTGHDEGDIIEINGQQCEISYFVDTLAYSKTLAHGGILKEGVYARVYHYKGKILRIDIRDDTYKNVGDGSAIQNNTVE